MEFEGALEIDPVFIFSVSPNELVYDAVKEGPLNIAATLQTKNFGL